MKFLLLVTIILASGIVFSQEDFSKGDVKVGLVLSGGGAKGMAHIGALKIIKFINKNFFNIEKFLNRLLNIN